MIKPGIWDYSNEFQVFLSSSLGKLVSMCLDSSVPTQPSSPSKMASWSTGHSWPSPWVLGPYCQLLPKVPRNNSLPQVVDPIDKPYFFGINFHEFSIVVQQQSVKQQAVNVYRSKLDTVGWPPRTFIQEEKLRGTNDIFLTLTRKIGPGRSIHSPKLTLLLEKWHPKIKGS